MRTVKPMSDRPAFFIAGVEVAAGHTGNVRLKISETYTGDPIGVPIRVIHARREGPVVFVSSAIHGDELNGTGMIHELMFRDHLELERGTLLLIPVINVFGLENNRRYMPDRRDLNRCFPGSSSGSLSGRVAAILMREVVLRSNFGIDLHTAAAQRTNFPNVRGDLTNPEVKMLAEAFGCELILNNKGPAGSLRRAACRKGCSTMIFEAGEPSKFEPEMVEVGVRGITNVLIRLGMLQGTPRHPRYQVKVDKFRWVRARVGGILRFHVQPGEIVERAQLLATNYSILGKEQNVLKSPADGVVLSVATSPTVKPGEPVAHIAIPEMTVKEIRRRLEGVGG